MKAFKYTCLLLCLFLLTSCTPQNTELKYRLVISGIGLDFDENENIYEVTVQVLNNTTGDEKNSENPTTTYTTKGITVSQAINSLIENTGKYPLYSQNRIIVLGKSVTGDTAIKALNFFVREYTSRPDVFVAAASGSAKDILTTSPSGEVSAKLIEESIEKCSINSLAIDTELYDAVNLSLEKTSAFTLPLLEVTQERNTKEKTVKVTGTRCHGKENNTLSLSDNETLAFAFLTNKVKGGTLNIVIDGTAVSLEIIKSKTKTKTISTKPEFAIEINCEADIVEFENDNFSEFTQNDIKKTEKAAAEYLNSIANSLLQRLMKEENCDIFRFGTRLNQKYGSDYTEKNTDFLKDAVIDLKINVSVNRIGQMNLKKGL